MTFILPEIEDYLKSLSGPKDRDIEYVQKEGQREEIPIVDEDVGRFLHLLILTHQPKKVLELGFGGGCSTLWMAKALGEGGTITSLDLNTDRVSRGQRIFQDLGLSSKLHLLYADALEYLRDTKETYDFIFLDAIKRSYTSYLPLIPRVLRKGGLFLADNILFRGNVVKEDPGKKYQAGTSSIKAFNKSLSASNDFKTVFLPIGDGLSFSLRL